MWQRVRAQNNILQNVRDLWPCYENPVCPDPVWKPVKVRRIRKVGIGKRGSSAQGDSCYGHSPIKIPEISIESLDES